MTDSRIPSLDGLRALAITMVVAQHLSSVHAIPALDVLWRFQLGDMGVRIFFVISGFLITTLLLREQARNGRIDLGAFYLRRTLRIFPAYFAFLGIIAVSAALGYQTLTAKEFVPSLTYLANYLEAPRVLGHTWSLAVEEQFYLLWPGLILLAGWRRSALLAAAFCLVAPALRGLHTFGNADPDTLFFRFELAGDALAWGCLYALIHARRRTAAHETLRRLPPALVGLAGLAAMIFLAQAHRWPLAWNIGGTVLSNLLIVVLLDAALAAPTRWPFAWLNLRPVMWVGTLSYSLYLWQQAFVYGGFRAGFPQNIALIIACACLSFYCIERPFLRIKARLDARRRERAALAVNSA